MLYDLIIIGGGSGGIGAAFGAKYYNNNSKILLAEKENYLGGTSTIGGVSNWEPGISSNLNYHKLIAEELQKLSKGFVAKTTVFANNDYPIAISEPCNDSYDSTLKRAGVSPENQRRFMFYHKSMAEIIYKLLKERNIDILLNSEVKISKQENKTIKSVFINGKEYFAKRFIDATGNINFARNCNCNYTIGEENQSKYSEPSAPIKEQNNLNGITLVFTAIPKEIKCIDQIPKEFNKSITQYIDFTKNTIYSCVYKYPDNTLYFNMLPTINGEYLLKINSKNLYNICKSIIYKYFEFLQKKNIFTDYKINYIAPILAERESYRLIGEKVLTENDLRKGIETDNRYIAYADHPLDTHNKNGGSLKGFNSKYGIDYECLLPKETDNLLIACKGASFSHIVASSCRLSRTMMWLGEAAGIAAIMSIKDNCPVKNIDIKKLQNALKIQKAP